MNIEGLTIGFDMTGGRGGAGRKQESTRVSPEINDLLRSGHSFYSEDVLHLISSLHSPIVVDMNETLISGRSIGPQVPHPYAKEALDRLHQAGTVVLCTTSDREWDSQHERLVDWEMWDESIVIVTGDTFMAPYFVEKERVRARIDQFIQFSEEKGNSYQFESLWRGIVTKRLAHVFMKPHLVPILDDRAQNVFENPGMLGILVEPFDTYETEDLVYSRKHGGVPLLQAVDKAVDFYNSFNQ